MASAPLLICIGGMSGSGKTSLAGALQKALPGAVHLDSDRTRKEIFGVSETTRLPAEAYSAEATQRVIAEMTRRIRENIAKGKTVIVSATFLSARNRADQVTLAAETGAQFAGVWLKADLKVLFDRVASRVNNPSDAGVEIVKMQAARAADPLDWPIIDATLPREDVAKAALKMIRALNAAASFRPPAV